MSVSVQMYKVNTSLGRCCCDARRCVLSLPCSPCSSRRRVAIAATLSVGGVRSSGRPVQVIEGKGVKKVPIKPNQQVLFSFVSPCDDLLALLVQPPFWSCDDRATMRDGMITTRADVYVQEIPDASDGVIVTSDSTLLQTSIPVADYDVPDRESHGHGDGDETRVGQDVNSTATFDVHPASGKRPTSYSESTDTDDRTPTTENDVCDAGPTPQAVALAIAESAFEFGSDPDGRTDLDPRAQPDTETKISRIPRNWLDTEKKKPVVRHNDSSCVVDCIYFTQQCCECVIF